MAVVAADALVVPRGGGVAAPFEDVAGDEDGAGNQAVDLALGLRADVDQDRARAERVRDVDGADAIQPFARPREKIVDRGQASLASSSISGTPASARETTQPALASSACWRK